MSAGSGPIRVAPKIITDTIHTTIIPQIKRLMIYRFTSQHSTKLLGNNFAIRKIFHFIIPVKTGIQNLMVEKNWLPAFAGMTGQY